MERSGRLTVAAAEFIHPARRIDDLLLTRIEWVARGANFHVQIAAGGGVGLERIAATAGHFDGFIVGMNVSFHGTIRQLQAKN
jgi:hypothetical protein